MTKFCLEWIAGKENNFFNGHEQKFTKQQQVSKNVQEYSRTFSSQRYNKPSERCGAVLNVLNYDFPLILKEVMNMVMIVEGERMVRSSAQMVNMVMIVELL